VATSVLNGITPRSVSINDVKCTITKAVTIHLNLDGATWLDYVQLVLYREMGGVLT